MSDDAKRVEAHIRKVDVGDCDGDGNRPVRLIPHVVPGVAGDVVVQWFIDGRPFGPQGPPTPVTGTLRGDGQSHTIDLRVTSPEGSASDTQRVDIPGCPPTGRRIRGRDVGGASAGPAPTHVEPGPLPDPAGVIDHPAVLPVDAVDSSVHPPTPPPDPSTSATPGWPTHEDIREDAKATACPSHSLDDLELGTMWSSFAPSGSDVDEPLTGDYVDGAVSDVAAASQQPTGYWATILRSDLLPTAGQGYWANLYFTNGVMTKASKARGLAKMLAAFFGVPRVRLVYNQKEEFTAFTAATLSTEIDETAYDYAWTQSGPSYSLPFGFTANGERETVAWLAILHEAWTSKVQIGIIGTSHGSLITAKAVMAFARAFPPAIPWLKSSVRMVHSGCVVHRNRYPLLRALLDRYEPHADPRDPFARVLGDHDRSPLSQHYEKQLPALMLKTLAPPPTHGDPYATRQWFIGPWLGLMTAVNTKDGVPFLSPYHAIEKCYVRPQRRHIRPEFFPAMPADEKRPIRSFRLRVTTGSALGAGTDDNVTFSIGGQQFNLDNPNRDDFKRGAVDVFDVAPATPLFVEDISHFVIEKAKGGQTGKWKLVGLNIEVTYGGTPTTVQITLPIVGTISTTVYQGAQTKHIFSDQHIDKWFTDSSVLFHGTVST